MPVGSEITPTSKPEEGTRSVGGTRRLAASSRASSLVTPATRFEPVLPRVEEDLHDAAFAKFDTIFDA